MILHSSMIKLCAHTFPSSASYHMSLMETCECDMIRVQSATIFFSMTMIRVSILYTLNIYFLLVSVISTLFGFVLDLGRVWTNCVFAAINFYMFMRELACCSTVHLPFMVTLFKLWHRYIYFSSLHLFHSTVRYETVGILHSKLGF